MTKKKCVLVVDDEPGILRVLSIQLRLHGYDAVTALSGMEAVELVRAREPDIVLLDILLPDINGFQVLEKVRGFSQVPVIVLSASQNAVALAPLAGADASISKPFHPDQLLGKIKSVLEARKPLDRSPN